MSSDPHGRRDGDARGELFAISTPERSHAAPLLPIELAIAEDAPDREAREFIAELVDVREELSELLDGSDD